MNAHVLSRRSRAVGFAIAVSIVMLGAAALASVGAVVAPSSSGGASNSPAVTLSTGSSAAGPSGQSFTVTVGGSSIVVSSSPISDPSPSVQPPTAEVSTDTAAGSVVVLPSIPPPVAPAPARHTSLAPSRDGAPNTADCTLACNTSGTWFSLGVTPSQHR